MTFGFVDGWFLPWVKGGGEKVSGMGGMSMGYICFRLIQLRLQGREDGVEVVDTGNWNENH